MVGFPDREIFPRRLPKVFAQVAPLSLRVTIFLLAGFLAGVSNGVAGGGTFIAFPALLAMGVPALTANVSTSVGMMPSYLGGLHGFRTDIARHRRLIGSLIASSITGTALGTWLLFAAPPATFRAVVPWLISGGTLAFALAPLLTRRLARLDHTHPARWWLLQIGVAAVAVYGGYFGAGLGILLLAVMAVALPLAIGELQGIRSVLSTVINVVAALIFVVRGHVDAVAALTLFGASALGGLVGTQLIKRLSPHVVRSLVVVIGVATALRLFLSA